MEETLRETVEWVGQREVGVGRGGGGVGERINAK